MAEADDAAAEPPSVSAIGGVFRAPMIRDRFEELLREAVPAVRLVASGGSGLDGAAALPGLPAEHPLHALVSDSGPHAR